MLHDGKVDDETVMCPMHGWVYELKTGRSLSGQGKVACYPVKVAGNDVLIEIADNE